MKRPNKQKCIDVIVDEIDLGKRYTDVWENYGKLWSISNPTFDKYWNEAKGIHEKKRQKIEKIKEQKLIEHELKNLEKDLITKDKLILNILSDIETLDSQIKELKNVIIAGKKIGEDIIVTTQQDVNNAKRTIAQLLEQKKKLYEIINQMQGYNAPLKSEIKVEEERLPPYFFDE